MVISLATVRASSARSRQYFGSLIGTLAMGLLLEPIMATMRMIARLTLWDTVGASRVPLDAYSFGLAPASPPGLSFQGRLLPTFSGTCLLGVFVIFSLWRRESSRASNIQCSAILSYALLMSGSVACAARIAAVVALAAITSRQPRRSRSPSLPRARSFRMPLKPRHEMKLGKPKGKPKKSLRGQNKERPPGGVP